MVTEKPKRRRQVKQKSDLQILNEARLSADLPPLLDMPDRENVRAGSMSSVFGGIRINFGIEIGQKVSRKKFPKQSQGGES